MDNKKKKTVSISIDKEILNEIEDLTTNRSRLIECLLIEHLNKFDIKTNDIIL